MAPACPLQPCGRRALGEETAPSISRSESESTSEHSSASGAPARRPAAAATSSSCTSFSPDLLQGALMVTPISQSLALRRQQGGQHLERCPGIWADPPAALTNRMWRTANRRPLQPIETRLPAAVARATRCCWLLQKPPLAWADLSSTQSGQMRACARVPASPPHLPRTREHG